MIGLLKKFKDVFPGYAQDCFMFDKLLFENITWEIEQLTDLLSIGTLRATPWLEEFMRTLLLANNF